MLDSAQNDQNRYVLMGHVRDSRMQEQLRMVNERCSLGDAIYVSKGTLCYMHSAALLQDPELNLYGSEINIAIIAQTWWMFTI